MTEKITEVAIILDRSGSMGRLKDATIEGFNTFIDETKKSKKTKCLVTLVQFDHEYEVNYMAKPIDEVENLDHSTYQPRGNTALHDAIGKTINGLSTRHANLVEEERPGQVVCVIITDGYENSSQEFANQAKAMILSKPDWDFVYLGANIDELAVAAAYGISVNTVSNYDNSVKGVGSTYRSTSRLLNEGRDMYSVGASASKRRMRTVSKDIDYKSDIVGSQSILEDVDEDE